MRKLLFILAGILFIQPAMAQSCNRDCLHSMLTRYLDAMLKHDPSLLPLAPELRFTEDMKALAPGEGLWQSIQGYGTFRQDVLDVRTGTAGTHVVAMEAGKPVLLALRLKIAADMITEIETTVVRNREEGMIFNTAAIIEASPAMNLVPTAAQRNTRADMERLALLYPEGLRVGSFVSADARFAADAYRFENGQLMAGPGCSFIPGCDHIREQQLPTLAGIQARVAAVDEELGIVWLRMNFGAGSLMSGEGELTVWEMFKIYDGQINAVEAYMEVVPAGSGFDWEY